MAWLDEVTAHLAAAKGLEADALAVSGDDTREILDIARIAAHVSGARTNAPLLSYVLGLARAQGVPLAELTATVRELTGDPDASS